MKALNLNKRTFWYANLSATSQPEPLIDGNGYETGEMGLTYDLPTEFQANISAALGINANYSKTIVTDNLTLPIDKSTILWIDKEPDANGEAGTVKHDYVVVAVAKSLNSITIAIKEVNVS